jgi:HSP20 family protein
VETSRRRIDGNSTATVFRVAHFGSGLREFASGSVANRANRDAISLTDAAASAGHKKRNRWKAASHISSLGLMSPAIFALDQIVGPKPRLKRCYSISVNGDRQHICNWKGGLTMAIRDLIPWNLSRDVAVRRGAETNPFLTLHREMNRLFDDAFRGFDLSPLGPDRMVGRALGGWPNIEVGETDKEVKVTAELPGLDEKDVTVELANDVLTIKGEKKTETEDKDRLFSERYYGRFERRIAVDQIEEDKVSASFKNGVLTVTLPKSAKAQENVKRVAINK